MVFHGFFELHFLNAALGYFEDHAEGFSHDAVVIDEANAENRFELVVEVASEPIEEVVCSELQLF